MSACAVGGSVQLSLGGKREARRAQATHSDDDRNVLQLFDGLNRVSIFALETDESADRFL